MRLTKDPWICIGCDNWKICKKAKYRYDPLQAQKNYQSTLSSSREGIHASKEELVLLNKILTPRVKNQKQSIYHVFKSNDVDFSNSISSLYHYIDKNYLEVKNIDLARRVRYKANKPAFTTHLWRLSALH